MEIIKKIKEKKQQKIELNEIEIRNAARLADVNAAITVASVSAEAATDLLIKSRHSRFVARAEVIRDRINQIFEAVRTRNIRAAKALDAVVGHAIEGLGTEFGRDG